jgi:two-component system, NarL family, nitrate/nitrite response regulator NarL
MDLLTSDADLRANSCLPGVNITLDDVCLSSRGSGADCRAVLVSERGLFLEGLRAMLGKSPISVIAESHNICGLLAAVRMRPAVELIICHIASDRKPEAVRDLVSGLRQHFARAKLVVLADACTASLLSSIASADVNAILLTSISSDMLLRSLELIRIDLRLFPSEIMPLLASSARSKPSIASAPAERSIVLAETTLWGRTQQNRAAPPNTPASDPQLTVPLSRREWQILDCLVRGWANKRIARELHIVEGTVKVHLKCLSRKLKMTNRTQLAIWALRQPQQSVSQDPVDSFAA